MTQGIVNHLWQSTVVVLAAGLLARLLRRHQARVRHTVWLAASLKFLVPFSLLIVFGGTLAWRTAPAAAGSATPAFVETVQTITEPFSDTSAALAQSIEVHPTTVIPWPLVLASLWILGAVVVLAMRIRGWQTVRAALRASTPATLPGVDDATCVRATSGSLEPGVVGIWRPVLLIPVGLDTLLTADQLRAVVGHELHHIQRRDNLTSALHMAVEAVFWFHPLVWWIGARLVDERERACDEYVVATGAQPDAYAEAILNVCKRYVEVPVACVAGVTGSDLKRRISAILAGRVGLDLSVSRKTLVALAAAVALGAPVVAGVITAPVRPISQVAGPIPTFDLVSVRPCEANAPGPGRGSALGGGSPGRLQLTCDTVLHMIQMAYAGYADARAHTESDQPFVPLPNEIVQSGMDHTGAQGVPDWVSHDRFTIEAKAEGEPPFPMMAGPMLQRVLEERFKVKVHREMREVPVYEMVAASGGAKLTPAQPGGCVPYDFAVSPQPALPAGQHRCENSNERTQDGGYVYKYEATTLDELAAAWSRGWIIDRPIVNKTGLTGLYTLQVVQAGHTTTADDARAAMIAEFKNRLGLELRPGKGPREYLILDHVERPDMGDPAPPSSTKAPTITAPAQRFDVASIRPCESTPNNPGGRNGGVGPMFSPGMFMYNCGTLEQLISGAYVMNGEALVNDEGRGAPRQTRDDKIFPQRIRGGPDWARTDRFLIEAKTAVSTGRSGREAVRERATLMGPMLRALLEDRFQLKLHRDVQDDVPMYALTVAKSGLKIKPAGPDSCAPPDPNRTEPDQMDQEIATVRKGGRPICGHGIMGGPVGPNNALVLNGQTMEGVAHFLSGIMDRHVLDKTGLADKFVIYLEYAPDDQVPYDFLVLPRPTEPATAPSITQVLKALGLELTPTKGPKGYLVIDHAERPKIDSGAKPLGAPRASDRERAARTERGFGGPASERVGEPAGAKPLGSSR